MASSTSHTFGTENPYTAKIEEDYKPHPRWGQPKQEGARPLSRYEYYFGPVEQQSTVELANQNLLNNLFIKPVQWFHSILEKTRAPATPWYHRRYERVPTIDECYFHDYACRYVLTFKSLFST